MPFSEIITGVSAALTIAKAGKDVAKTLIDIDNKVEQAELKIKYYELVTKFAELTEQLITLKGQLTLREAMRFDGSVYWKDGEEHTPYCARCYDVDGKTVHLHAQSTGLAFWCWGCKKEFTNRKGRPAGAPPPATVNNDEEDESHWQVLE
jgi:hypothetical protein